MNKYRPSGLPLTNLRRLIRRDAIIPAWNNRDLCVCAGTRRKKKGHEHKNDAEQSLLLKINKEEEWLVYTIPLLLFPLGFQPGPGGVSLCRSKLHFLRVSCQFWLFSCHCHRVWLSVIWLDQLLDIQIQIIPIRKAIFVCFVLFLSGLVLGGWGWWWSIFNFDRYLKNGQFEECRLLFRFQKFWQRQKKETKFKIT
jgi:hypothetical protein